MKSVVILRLSALGDVAMTVPVIYSVARQYLDVKFTLVTRPFFRKVFINPPINLSFIDFDAKGLHKGFGGLMTLIKGLKKQRFSAVADLHDLPRTRLIRAVLRLTGSSVAVVDKNRRGRKNLTKGKQREFQQNYVDRYTDVFARLGMPIEPDFQSVFAVAEVRCGVGIAPFARYQTKTYPPEMMERVAQELTEAGIDVTLFGASGREQHELDQWVERNPKLKSLAGQLPIEEEIREMSRLRVMVTMDSANMHLASLAGTPVVSVWGSTIPQCGFLGYGQSSDDAVWVDLPCQPCSVAGLPECPLGHMECMRQISPQQIIVKIQKFLNQNG